MSVEIRIGDCLDVLKTLDAQSVQTCVSSPPYFGLRDYGVAGQIGLESTPGHYVDKPVAVFREVWRVLKDDGTLWLNLGDSYNTQQAGNRTPSGFSQTRPSRQTGNGIQESVKHGRGLIGALKPKDLLGIPWRVALALQADGWYLRSDIIWAKPNPMPESVTDRPTKAHEYLFLMAKSERYYYDAAAITEQAAQPFGERRETGQHRSKLTGNHSGSLGSNQGPAERNRRSVWTVATQPYSGAHFATFPPALIEPCILAGSRVEDTVLDPFGGAGTTGLVADRLQRNAMLIELNPEYAALARNRIYDDAPLLNQDGAA